MALVAPVHIGPLDGDAGQALDLLDLPGQGMAVVGITGQCLHSDDELASRGARVGDRDGGLYPELVARPRLALGDAFDLGRVQRIELVGAVRFLGQDLCRDCQEFRVWAGIMGKKESLYVPTKRTCDPV